MNARVRRALLFMFAGLYSTWIGSSRARADESVDVPQARDATFSWDEGHNALYASFSFRDAIDSETQAKLTRGLPTEILLTALVYTADSDNPVSTTFQTCRITWHVWEEMYRVEITRANQPKGTKHWTPSLSGVLRRCAEANNLLVADSGQVSPGKSLYLRATVRVNPVSEELLSKLQRWVSRPSPTTTAAPGSALFSTFTGLFMQRIGDAERTVTFATFRSTPK
ncbi:MAG TPA: DUF4390 domain-containing protein [Polyangiaceae bacterium]|jgi:hypothetical protein|nr:DUF4390 domain-containing protein [Polyangiaceae bacterium]